MKLELIEWVDACTSNAIWTCLDDELHILPNVSVGIVLREDEKEIEICLTKNWHSKIQSLAIPKSCITRRRKLCLK